MLFRINYENYDPNEPISQDCHQDQGQLFEATGKGCRCKCSMISGVIVGKEYSCPEEIPEVERPNWLRDDFAAQDLEPLDEEARKLHAELILCPAPSY